MSPDLQIETPDLILVMLAREGGASGFRGITRLEKLMFLLTKEGDLGSVKPPAFDAYKFGPYSKDVYDSIEFLRSIELVEGEDSRGSPEDAIELRDLDPDVAPDYEPRTFRLTEKGRRVAEKLREQMGRQLISSIDKILAGYGRMPLSQLISYVYNQYPEYTSKSLIRAQVFGKGR